MVAWEFCYEIITNNVTLVTFYPGIWRITGTSGNNSTINYGLVQSNAVTFDSSVRDPLRQDSIDNCQIFNLSDTDQFTAPAGSVMGLYTNDQDLLLHTNTNSSIATYQFSGMRSIVNASGFTDVNYNIAIKVHLGKCSGNVKYEFKEGFVCVCGIVIICAHVCIMAMSCTVCHMPLHM